MYNRTKLSRTEVTPTREYNSLTIATSLNILHSACNTADVTASNVALEIAQCTNSITDMMYIKAEALSIHDVD